MTENVFGMSRLSFNDKLKRGRKHNGASLLMQLSLTFCQQQLSASGPQPKSNPDVNTPYVFDTVYVLVNKGRKHLRNLAATLIRSVTYVCVCVYIYGGTNYESRRK